MIKDNWTLLDGFKKKFNINSNFKVYINNDKTIIWKKRKRNFLSRQEKKFFPNGNTSGKLETDKIYIDTILDKDNKHFCAIKGFDVKGNGSYKSEFINGYTLYELMVFNSVIDTDIKKKKLILEKKNIIESLEKFKINFNKEKCREGDWNINNLIYCLKTKKIYNIDLEGFFPNKHYVALNKHVDRRIVNSIVYIPNKHYFALNSHIDKIILNLKNLTN